jgi:hypothetical protein
MSEQPKWLVRAKETYKFHRSRLISTDDWTVAKTARTLRRSLGSVSEDLLIARWCKTHEKVLEEFLYSYEALKFIRKKQKELEIAEIE